MADTCDHEECKMASTSTEKALSTPEILSMILACADKKTQTCCARVCTHWFHVVIPVIWQSIDRLNYLFDLLPEGGWVGKYKMVDDTDWIRFNLYSRHVRKLLVSKRELEGSLSTAIEEIAIGRRVTCLLPNLRDLSIDSCGNPYSPLLLLNEGVKRLALRPYSYSESHFGIICSYIIPKATNLVYLCLDMSLTYGIFHTYDEDPLIHVLRKLRTLEDLEIEGIELSPLTLGLIGLLPKLIRFRYSVGGLTTKSSWPDMDAIRTESATSSQLKKLTLQSKIFSQRMLDAFLDLNIHYPNLESLEIEIRDFYNELQDVTKTLMRCCEVATLKMENISKLCIKLYYRHVDSNGPTNGILNLKYLRLLSRLTRMQDCFLRFESPVSITDMDVGYVVRNWPNLVSFKLYSAIAPKFIPKTTLRLLQVFGINCKDLEYLSIRVDGTTIPELPPSMPVVPLRKLKLLEVGYSPINDVDAVALYLSRFCFSSCQLALPNGKSFMEGESIPDLYKKRWNYLKKQFNLIRKAIEQDRRMSQVVEASEMNVNS